MKRLMDEKRWESTGIRNLNVHVFSFHLLEKNMTPLIKQEFS